MKLIDRVKEFVLERDVYGHPIAVHFKGKTAYNTWLGVLCTFLVYGVVFQSVIALGGAFLDHSRQDQKVDVEKFDRFDSESFNLIENGVKFYIFPYQQTWGFNEDT